MKLGSGYYVATAVGANRCKLRRKTDSDFLDELAKLTTKRRSSFFDRSASLIRGASKSTESSFTSMALLGRATDSTATRTASESTATRTASRGDKWSAWPAADDGIESEGDVLETSLDDSDTEDSWDEGDDFEWTSSLMDETGECVSMDETEEGQTGVLKTKLDAMIGKVSSFAFGAASVASVVLLLWHLFDNYVFNGRTFDFANDAHYVLKSIVIGISIVVVAVPEGLRLAVTLSVSISMKQMMLRDHT